MRWFHRIARTAFGKRTNSGGITKQLGQRDFRVNDGKVSPALNASDAAAPPAQVAADIALKFFRRDVFDLHDRLEQDRFALLEAVFHREDGGKFEGEFV